VMAAPRSSKTRRGTRKVPGLAQRAPVSRETHRDGNEKPAVSLGVGGRRERRRGARPPHVESLPSAEVPASRPRVLSRKLLAHQQVSVLLWMIIHDGEDLEAVLCIERRRLEAERH